MTGSRRRSRKYITGVLCMIMLVLGACGSPGGYAGEKGSGEKDDSAGAMGRYMETCLALPEEVNRNGGLNCMADGSLTVISFGSGLYRSVDEGESWQQEETDWFSLLENVYCMSAVMSPDGAVAATCSGQMSEAVRTVYEKEVPDDWEGNYLVFALPDKVVKVVDFGFSQEDGSCISTLCFKEDGRLFAGDMNGKIYEVDLQNFSLKELFEADGEVGCMSFAGDVLMVVGYNGLYRYHLAEEVLLPQDKTLDDFLKKALGEKERTVAYTGGGYPIVTFGGEDGSIYLACGDGVYRHAPGGNVIEQVIDGALSSFGDAGNAIYNMKELPGQEFLTLFEPSVGLVRYTFDEKVPAMPEKEIRIYSLEENGSVRQAVTAYKKEHTDMYVRYEVGIEDENGVTKEDAIKKLNTRILGEEGPDVLILDGLPAESWQKKGLLRDMSGMMKDTEKELFPNLVESFREEDGKIYAMPMCIRVPLLAGEEDVISSMTDLESFAAGMERFRQENPEGGILGIYDAESLIELFGMVSCDAWTDGEGQIDRASVEDFLYQMKRIYDAELAGEIAEERAVLEAEDAEMEEYGEDTVAAKLEICGNVLNIPRGYARIACGYVEGIQLCLDNVTSVIKIEEGMTYRIFNGQQQEVFLPKAIAGINAKTEHPEEAEAFVRKMLSEETQESIYDGFPVNRAAFEEAFRYYEPGAGNGSMTLQKKDNTEQKLELYWPDAREEEMFTELTEGLRTPVKNQEWLTELVCEIGVKVLEEDISVEEGVSEIEKRAKIYLAE